MSSSSLCLLNNYTNSKHNLEFKTTIGRLGSNTIILSSPSVSKIHAVILIEISATAANNIPTITLYDCQSTNGCFYRRKEEGSWVQVEGSTPLKVFDQIKFGNNLNEQFTLLPDEMRSSLHSFGSSLSPLVDGLASATMGNTGTRVTQERTQVFKDEVESDNLVPTQEDKEDSSVTFIKSTPFEAVDTMQLPDLNPLLGTVEDIILGILGDKNKASDSGPFAVPDIDVIPEDILMEFFADQEMGERVEGLPDGHMQSIKLCQQIVEDLYQVLKQNQVLLNMRDVDTNETQELNIITEDGTSETLQSVNLSLYQLTQSNLLYAISKMPACHFLLSSLDFAAASIARLIYFLRDKKPEQEVFYRVTIHSLTAVLTDVRLVLHTLLRFEHLIKQHGRKMSSPLGRSITLEQTVMEPAVLSLTVGEQTDQKPKPVELTLSPAPSSSSSLASSRSSLGAELDEIRRLKSSIRMLRSSSSLLSRSKGKADESLELVKISNADVCNSKLQIDVHGTHWKEHHFNDTLDKNQMLAVEEKESSALCSAIERDVQRAMREVPLPYSFYHSPRSNEEDNREVDSEVVKKASRDAVWRSKEFRVVLASGSRREDIKKHQDIGREEEEAGKRKDAEKENRLCRSSNIAALTADSDRIMKSTKADSITAMRVLEAELESLGEEKSLKTSAKVAYEKSSNTLGEGVGLDDVDEIVLKLRTDVHILNAQIQALNKRQVELQEDKRTLKEERDELVREKAALVMEGMIAEKENEERERRRLLQVVLTRYCTVDIFVFLLFSKFNGSLPLFITLVLRQTWRWAPIKRCFALCTFGSRAYRESGSKLQTG